MATAIKHVAFSHTSTAPSSLALWISAFKLAATLLNSLDCTLKNLPMMNGTHVDIEALKTLGY